MRRRINPNLIGNILELEERTSRVEAIMRVIGYSPEKPYTLTVNDGTRNRVEIGLIDGVYGIKIVDNAGGEVILANGSINADAITVGTLDAGVITVTNIDADSITTGTLEADFIVGGTLDCSTMTVQSLNAGSITVGSFININDRLNAQAIHGDKITADTLNANRIVAGSITSNEIQSHSISGDVIAFGTLTGDHLNVRTITADRIQVGTLTTTEINYMSGSKLTNVSVYGNRIVSSPSLSGYVSAPNISASNSIDIGVGVCGNGLYLQSGKAIIWSGGEGNIYDVDIIEGYNDLRLFSHGADDAVSFHSTAGGGSVTIYPYYGEIWKTGSCHFRIDHPEDEDRWLQYAAAEAPEIVLTTRGLGQLINGVATIFLPHHWDLATEEYLTTIQLTPLEDCNGLYAPKTQLTRLSFEVRELNSGNSNAEFSWELSATRRGKADYQVEPLKDDIIERVVNDTIADKLTKTKYKKNISDKKAGIKTRKEKLAKIYKKKTGKKYVDGMRVWKDEILGIKEGKAKAAKLLKEKAELMAERGEE